MKGKTICRFPASKPFPQTILTEGILETEFCYHLEVDKTVLSYESQPIGFYYFVEGQRRVYTPDFEVVYSDGVIEYFEVKQVEFLTPDFYENFHHIQRAADQIGKSLILITDETIQKEPYLSNIKAIHKANVHSDYSSEFEKLVLFALSTCEIMTIENLLEVIEAPDGLGAVIKLISDGKVLADLSSAEFGPELEIRRCQRG